MGVSFAGPVFGHRRLSLVRDKTKISARIYPGVKINGKLALNPLTVAKRKVFDFLVSRF